MVADGKPLFDDGNQKRKRNEGGDSSSSSKAVLAKKPRLDPVQSAPVKTRRVKRTNEEKARQANLFSQPGFLRTTSTPTAKVKTAVAGSTKRSVSTPKEIIEISSSEDEAKQKKKIKKKQSIAPQLKEPIILDSSSDSDEVRIVKKPRAGTSKEKNLKPTPSDADIIELSDSDDLKPVKKEPVDPSPSDAKGKGKIEIPPLSDDSMDVDMPADNSMDIEPLPLFLPSPSKESPSPHAAEPASAISETTRLETSKQTSIKTSVTGPKKTLPSSSRTAPVHDDILPPSLTRIPPLAPAEAKTTPPPRTPDKVPSVMKTTPPIPSTAVITPAKVPSPVPIEAPIPVVPVKITSLATAAVVTTVQPLPTSAVPKPSSPRPSSPDLRPPRSSTSTASMGSLSHSVESSSTELPSSSKPLPPPKSRPSLPSVPSSMLRPSLPNVGPPPSSAPLPVSEFGRLRPSLPDPGSPPASAPPVQRSLPSLPDVSSKHRRSLPHLDPPPSSAPPLSGRPRPSLPDPNPPPPSASPRSLPSSSDQRPTASSPPKTPSFVKKPNIGDMGPRFSQTARKRAGQKRPPYSSETPGLHIDFRQLGQGEQIKAEKSTIKRSSSNIAEVIAAAGRSNATRSTPSSSGSPTHSRRPSDGSFKHPSSSSSEASSSRRASSVASASSHSHKYQPSLPSGTSSITNVINEAGRHNASPLSALPRNKPFASTVDAFNEASRLNADSASSLSHIRMDKPRSLSSSDSSSVRRSLPKVNPSLPAIPRPVSTSSLRRNKVKEVVPSSEPSDDGTDGNETGDSGQRPTVTGFNRSLPMPRSKNPSSEAKPVSRSSFLSGSSKPDLKRIGNVNRSEDVVMEIVADSQDITMMTDTSSEATLEDLDQGNLLDESAILSQLMLRDSTPSSVADDLNIGLSPSDAFSGIMPLQTPLNALTEATADLSISQQASGSPPRSPPSPKRPRGRPRKYPLPQSAPIVANTDRTTYSSRDTLAPTTLDDLSGSQQASSSPPRTASPLKRPRGRPRKHPLPQSAPIVANTAETTSSSQDTLAPTVNTVPRGISPLEYMDDDEAEKLQAQAQDRLRLQAAQSSVSASTARKRTSREANLSEDDTNSDEDSSPIRPRRRSRGLTVKSPSPIEPPRRSSRGASRTSSTSASYSRANSVEAPRYQSYSETPEESPLRSESPQEGQPSVRYIDGVAIYTWKDQKAMLAASVPKVYWARNIPTSLHDKINAMSDITKNLEPMRDVLKGVMRENTCEDEPDAPEIDIVNNIDAAATPPWEFYYSNRMWFSDEIAAPTMHGLQGCDCVGPCDPKNKKCACLKRQQQMTKEYVADFAYTSQKRLKTANIPIVECNALCRCDETCRNRVVQAGRKVDIRLEKTKNKGWGVFANNKIPGGSYIGIYAGELLTEAEGESRGHDYNRLGRTYLFNIDFWHLNDGADDWDNKYVVDAFHAGNFTRFLNHSCEPNCHLTACYINDPDIERPLLTLFALKDIQAGQELTFSYGGFEDDDDGPSSPKKHEDAAVYAPCLCGAAKCRRKLFN